MRRYKSIVAIAALSALGACATPPGTGTLTGDYLAGRFAANANAIDDAAAAYASAHADAPGEPSILADAFLFQLATGDIDAAAPFARDMLASAPSADDGLARVALAAHALKYGRLQEAHAALDGDMSAQFVKSIAFLMDVWIEEGLSGPAAAIVKLEGAGNDVFSGFNPLHKALLSEQAGLNDAARAAHQASVHGLGGPVGRAAYGAFLERAGEKEAAREYYSLIAGESAPGRRAAEDAFRRLDRGTPTNAFKRTAPAEGAAIAFYSFAGALVEQAADQRTRAEEAGFVVGEPRYNFPLALARIALYLDPELVEARRLVGSILNVYGDYHAAAGVLAAIPASSPHFEQARIEMAGGLVARERSVEAASLLAAAIKSDPGGVELKSTLANLYASEGRHADAVRTLSGVIKSLGDTPDDNAWRFFVSRGASLIELGKWEDAEADLKRAVEIAPEEPSALNYLGYSWAERGVHLEEAFGLIEKAVALQPQSGAIVDSLGWAHYQLGDYKEAVTHLERAAMLEPSDPTITDHLGDVYWRLGRVVEARYQWRRALELDPAGKLQDSLRDKLNRGLDPAAAIAAMALTDK